MKKKIERIILYLYILKDLSIILCDYASIKMTLVCVTTVYFSTDCNSYTDNAYWTKME